MLGGRRGLVVSPACEECYTITVTLLQSSCLNTYRNSEAKEIEELVSLKGLQYLQGVRVEGWRFWGNNSCDESFHSPRGFVLYTAGTFTGGGLLAPLLPYDRFALGLNHRHHGHTKQSTILYAHGERVSNISRAPHMAVGVGESPFTWHLVPNKRQVIRTYRAQVSISLTTLDGNVRYV